MPKLKEKPAAKSDKKGKRKFRVVEGHHYHGDFVFTKGMIIESKLPLDEMFRNKLEVVPSEIPASKGIHKDDFKLPQAGAKTQGGVKLKLKREKVSQDPEWDDDEDEMGGDEEEGEMDFASQAADVTEMFPFVMEEAKDLRVVSDGKLYGIVQEDDHKKLLNDQPLKKNEVKKFVEQYLDE